MIHRRDDEDETHKRTKGGCGIWMPRQGWRWFMNNSTGDSGRDCIPGQKI